MYCDGNNSNVVKERECRIPGSILSVEPYNLRPGSLVYAIITATNLAGESEESPAGYGAKLWTVPDAPTSL